MTGRQQLEAAFDASWRHGVVLLFFALLPLATTWPLAVHLGTHVPGEVAGDNLSTLWSFWSVSYTHLTLPTIYSV